MKRVGIFEAKADLPALVEEVEKGGSVVTTRDGKPVAKLVRAEPELTEEEIASKTEALLALRKLANELKINATQEEIKAWINEGRH